jgi:glycoprotein endo-alpha-1,2-mannosidase
MRFDIARYYLFVILIAGMMPGCSSSNEEQPQKEVSYAKPVVKTNTSVQVYMHYMPWFQSKPFSGYWGQHWRMSNKNPEVVDANGKRQIASHYYPLIGPYDSNDPDVVEYHLLLMKYAGIDVVLMDWYGSSVVTEYQALLTASNTLIDKTFFTGMKFGIVYEEFTTETASKQTQKTPVQVAQADLAYMQENYFKKDNYAIMNSRPLLMTFGPRFIKTSAQWNEIFTNADPQPLFLPLWFHASMVGGKANGEFGWIDFTDTFTELNKFYTQNASGTKMGSAFPRYHDFYVEGGWGKSYGNVDDKDGQTLAGTIKMATDNNVKHLQFVTWNDFGEGTVIEPTEEDQFTFLKAIQSYTGVSYGEEELQMVYNYYLKKKKYASDKDAMETLKKVFNHMVALETEQAKDLLDKLQ